MNFKVVVNDCEPRLNLLRSSYHYRKKLKSTFRIVLKEEEYFSALENLTGITKTTYNKEVSKLIEEEVKVLGI